MPVRVRVNEVTGRLVSHHDRILEALTVMGRVLESGNPDPNDVHALVQFMQKFVDACHHGVEEYILFSGANRRGFPLEGGPIYVMVSEHGVGRYLARLVEESYRAWLGGDPSALRDMVDYARMYADHLSQHIEKENRILFPALEAHYGELTATRTVEEVEREHQYESWVALLEELKRKYGG